MGATAVADFRPRELELADIQGIIRRGYADLKAARFVLLQFHDPSKTRQWLSILAPQLRDARERPGPADTAVNIAFTHDGIIALGLDKHLIKDMGFASAFEEGMHQRGTVLGDHGTSAPEFWSWGGTKNDKLHAVLMLYAGDDEALDALVATQTDQLAAFEVKVLAKRLDGIELPGRKEHFGFRDGISQPLIAGLDETIPASMAADSARIFSEGGVLRNIVAAGEFLLGYPNLYRRISQSPSVKEKSDPTGALRGHPEGGRDLGRNGSYMVFRQLRQDVTAFWKFVDSLAPGETPAARNAERDRLGAKMVGRWRDGCPIVKAPTKSDPTLCDDNNFGYFEEDRFGEACPVASHIRRSNPRDCIDPDAADSDVARVSVDGHRMIRRGRPYGPPVAPSMEPADIIQAPEPKESAGLQFICFNADIARQFEFVQQTWILSPKFGGLYASSDPLAGDANPDAVRRGLFGEFVMPDDAFRDRKEGLQRFVHVEGGAYFFMPGISAVRYMAALRGE